MNRTSKAVFIASLILNVLLIGAVLGALPRRFGEPPPFRDRIKSDIEKLPEPARTRMRENMNQIHTADRPFLSEIDAARNEALRIMATDPFDEAAYDRQVEKIEEIRSAMFKRMSDSIKRAVKGLPLDQRKAVAEIFKRPPPGPPP